MGDHQWYYDNLNYPPPTQAQYNPHIPPQSSYSYTQWSQSQQTSTNVYSYPPVPSYPPPPIPASYIASSSGFTQQQHFDYRYSHLQSQYQTAGTVNDYTKDLENYRYIKSRVTETETEFIRISEKSRESMDSNGNGLSTKDFAPSAPSMRNNYLEATEDLDFVYDDCDIHANEIAELYSYTEHEDLHLNLSSFEDQLKEYDTPQLWRQLNYSKRRSVVLKILDQLELSDKVKRMKGARCILYIAQGSWLGIQSDTDQIKYAKENCILLYQLGTFNAFVDLLNLEVDNNDVSINRSSICMSDSEDLRIILSVLYTIVEVLRSEKDNYPDLYKAFCADLMNSEDLLITKLFNMLTKFCAGSSSHFPIKKILLLLWKLILVTLGGIKEVNALKLETRKKYGLQPLNEDSDEIVSQMRPSSPPTFPPDLLEDQNQRRKRSLIKQSSLEDFEPFDMESTEGDQTYMKYNNSSKPFDSHYVMDSSRYSKLPWKPKVHKIEVDMFLNMAREKFLGYSLEGDDTTIFGLPKPIHESINILKEHVYTSVAELQIQREEEINRNPLTTKDDIDLSPVEILYQSIFPNLPQYMICLLKILLATMSRAKSSTDSINILGDILPKEMPLTNFQSLKLGIDVNRHKEIIVKAVSGILVLLLKHFKRNHIYQFEFMSQHLVFANCIPLILKFHNQEIMNYIKAGNDIPVFDFPSCVLGDGVELSSSIEIRCDTKYCWRNVFSSINLLRVLNKLCKWKNSRIMVLVVFKSAPILKRILKVRHGMSQLYVLKLLKMQTKYLGRNWRKSNLKTVSLIYQKVRHHLNDDWAFGNFLDAKPWDYQSEEITLRTAVDKFNNRRYVKSLEADLDLEPVDNNLTSVLGHELDFSESFQKNYYLWLEDEVFQNAVEWDSLF
ncbi:unnamed protein product [Diabrotica balteata]|uniref:Far11/STRP C-terminal domain-containing protein n=1 Tax=Diabrotica balteata TaxID=107213 RepID=A0A9N9TA24_DIABA|nr:unnamed protein product [Diabrotica balteata]